MKTTESKAREPLSRDTIVTLCLMAVTAVLVIGTGIYYKQAFLRLLPLCNSLFIAFLLTRANRYAPLLIGFNAILYAASFFHYHLYANAAYALCVSCPLQLITFFRWHKKPYKQSTVFRKMTGKQRLFWSGIALAVWAIASLLFYRFQSDFNLLDTTGTVLGMYGTILSLLSYMEFPFFTAVTSLSSSLLFFSKLGSDPTGITYAIYYIYSLICAVKTYLRTRQLYAEQQAAKAP